MSTTTRRATAEEIEYPESDGEPMAENTIQEWIGGQLRLFGPDGRSFISPLEHAQRADEQEHRAERLAAQLRALGIEPEA